MATDIMPESTKKNDSIEKGIFLTFGGKKLVHACKVREDIGVGMTRCGMTFIIGLSQYKPDAVFGAPPTPDSDGTFTKCERCTNAADYSAFTKRWRSWRYAMIKTLIAIGARQRQPTSEVK